MAAPSAVNIATVTFVVVTNRETLDELCANFLNAKLLDKQGSHCCLWYSGQDEFSVKIIG